MSPPELEASFNLRYSPAWTADTLISEIESIFEKLGVKAEFNWQPQGDPFLTVGGPLVDTTLSVIRELTGIDAEPSTGGGTSDGRFIAPTGAQVVELGPVNATIHKVNERVRVDDVQALSRIYEEIARRLLA